MKRRGFLSKLLGGIAAAPVVVKAFEAEARPGVRRIGKFQLFIDGKPVDHQLLQQPILPPAEVTRNKCTCHGCDTPGMTHIEPTEYTVEVGGERISFMVNTEYATKKTAERQS